MKNKKNGTLSVVRIFPVKKPENLRYFFPYLIIFFFIQAKINLKIGFLFIKLKPNFLINLQHPKFVS